MGALLPTALGLSGVVAAIVGATTGGTAVRVVVGCLGLAFLAVGAGLLYWRVHAPPHAWLDLDADAVILRTGKAVQWRHEWSEISDVSLTRSGWSWRSRLSVRGPALRLVFPRHHLRLRVAGEGKPVSVDLGVPGRAARDLAAALGSRLA